MSQEQLCAECRKSGTECISRCGHILHKGCFENLSSHRCPICGIDFSRDIEVEKVFGNIFASGMDHSQVKELHICLEKFTDEECEDQIISFNSLILEKLYNSGWNINEEKFGGPNRFYKACEFDDLHKVNLLIEFGLDLNKYGPEGLKKANSSFDVFERLIKLGVKLNHEIIFETIRRGNCKMFRRLIKEGVDINFKEPDVIMPIHFAAQVGSVKMVKLLIENGADVASKDDDMNSILHNACLSRKGIDLIKFLIDSGHDLEVKNVDMETPLFYAVFHHGTEVTELLIEKGANINAQDKDGDSPLHVVASEGKANFMAVLISKGANVNAKNHEGKTPLHEITRSRNTSTCANLLLDNGADLNILDNLGNPPLFYLQKYLDKETLEKIAVRDIDKNFNTEDLKN